MIYIIYPIKRPTPADRLPENTMTKKPGAAKGASAPPARKAMANKTATKSAKAASPAKPAAKKPGRTAEKSGQKPAEKRADKPVAKPKAEKIKKPKLVRDSFTMPEQEYALLGKLKKACLAAGVEIKKSELLRIGVAQLAGMDAKKLSAAQAALTPLKAGRPKKQK